MNRKEIRQRVYGLIQSGVSKSGVFAQLSGKGIKDARLADVIASYADPERYREHRVKAWVLAALTSLSAVFGLPGQWDDLVLIEETNPVLAWALVLGVLGITVLFVRGLLKPVAFIYRVTILVSAVNLLRNLIDGISGLHELVALVAMAGIVVFTWHTFRKLFPDFKFLWPRKSAGRYVFSD